MEKASQESHFSVQSGVMGEFLHSHAARNSKMSKCQPPSVRQQQKKGGFPETQLKVSGKPPTITTNKLSLSTFLVPVGTFTTDLCFHAGSPRAMGTGDISLLLSLGLNFSIAIHSRLFSASMKNDTAGYYLVNIVATKLRHTT